MKKLSLACVFIAAVLPSTAALAEQTMATFNLVSTDPSHFTVVWDVNNPKFPSGSCSLESPTQPTTLNCWTDENGKLSVEVPTLRSTPNAPSVAGPTLSVTGDPTSYTYGFFQIKNNGDGGITGSLEENIWKNHMQIVFINFVGDPVVLRNR